MLMNKNEQEKKKDVVAAFDFDGTLTNKDTLIAFICFTHGRRRLFMGFLRHAPWLLLMKIGLYPNWKAKEKVFSYFYKGTAYEQFAQWGQEFADVAETMLNKKTVGTLKRHLSEGHKVCVVTASIDEWVRPVCRRLGVGTVLATRIEVSVSGRLTGRLLSSRPDDEGKNCYGSQKVVQLLEAFPHRQSYRLYAYGDSRGDDELLSLADVGFCNGQRWHRAGDSGQSIRSR